ncbi:MAG: hypothetical protein DSY89_09110, partial [Deltaproteobacteria bacterium]
MPSPNRIDFKKRTRRGGHYRGTDFCQPGGSRQTLLGRCQHTCREYDTLLIFDEIIEGFGRTGK